MNVLKHSLIYCLFFVLVSNSLKAQIMTPLPKYTHVEEARNFLYYLSQSKARNIPYIDSFLLRIDSANQLKQVIAQKAENRIIGVDILTENRPNLDEIFKLLTQFPYLRELRLSDRQVTFSGDKPYQLPAAINQLTHLTTVSLSGNKLDMDDALQKLEPMQNLRSLAIGGYYKQLSPEIFKLRQITKMSLSAENIGDNDLSQVTWESVLLSGDSFRLGQDWAKVKYTHDAKALAAIKNIKTLKRLDLYLYGPLDSLNLSLPEQLTELKFHPFRWHQNVLTQIGKLTQLKKLTVEGSGSGLISIACLKNLTALTDLKLDFRATDYDPPLEGTEVITRFKKLENLDISNAMIDLPDDVFTDMPALKHVALDRARMKRVPLSLFNLPELEFLYIANNKIAELPDLPKYGCSKLKYLWIDHNQLTYLPEAISNLPALVSISAYNNGISMTSGDYGNLKSLKDIEMSYNMLDQYPKGLAGNQSLETATFRSNNIKVIPEPARGNYQLKTLTLNENPIVSLPGNIDRYKNLQELSLSGGKLTEIPEALAGCDSLKYLNLTNSVIAPTRLPPNLKRLKKLTGLTLAGEPLIDHTSIFDFVLALRDPKADIRLQADSITELPATNEWSKVKLQDMDLSGNKISTLPKQFAYFKGNVYLANNAFNIEKGIFREFIVNKAGLKIIFNELNVAFPNYKISGRDYAWALIRVIPDLFEEHRYDKVVEFADKAKAADAGYYQRNFLYQVGISRFNMGDYKQAIKDLSPHSAYDFMAEDYKAKAFLILKKPDSAAKTYASIRTLYYFLRADSICKISGNKVLAQQLKDSLENAYKRAMDYRANNEYFNSDELVYGPKDSYHYFGLIEYASFKLMDHKPLDAIAVLNKKVISGWDLSAKALLTAAANYLANPKTYDEGEKAVREVVKKRGQIKYYGFVPFTDWLPYSDYTPEQKEHLLALQKIACK